MATTVFLTDGRWRKTLAATRSLRLGGYRVIVGSDIKLSISFVSKYCCRRIIYPSPKTQPEEFSNFIIKFIKNEKPDVTIPMEDVTTLFFSRNIQQLAQFTRIPVVPYDNLANGIEKARTIKAAQEIGIPVPKTSIIASKEGIEKPAPYPLIVKPSYGSGARGLKTVNNDGELASAVKTIISSGTEAIVQELIPGEGAGYGVSVLFNYESCPRAVFVHKRLREFPVNGGPSTLRVSVKYPELAQMGIALLKHLHWKGVAMVEFKMDTRDGIPKIMEINPRFWGSLQLAISAGVDFPCMLAKLALEGDIPEQFEYRENVVVRWLLPGDILHFMFNPNRFKLKPSFFNFFGKDLKYDIISSRDPLPALLRILEMFIFLFNSKMRRYVFR